MMSKAKSFSKLLAERGRRAGLLCGVLCAALAACDPRNIVVVSLEGLPSAATSLGVYYRLDGGAWKASTIKEAHPQFGLELPVDVMGHLETQVHAYGNDVPCSLASGSGAIDVSGKYRQNLTVPLTMTADHCVGAVEPVDFPTQKMSIFAAAANDIWLVGEAGKILRWNGNTYYKVPLPAEFAAQPPDWNAIWGDASAIWIAGSKSSVARFKYETLTAVTALGPGGQAVFPLTDWRAIGSGDPRTGDVFFAGTGGVFGYIGSAATTIAKVQFTCAAFPPPGYMFQADGNVTEDLNAVSCAVSSTQYRCYFAGNGGRIVRYFSYLVPPSYTMNTTCIKLANPFTTDWQGIYAAQDSSQLEVSVVGKGGMTMRGFASAASNGDPDFMNPTYNYSSYLPTDARVDLNAMTGSTLDDVSVVGQRGVLLNWRNTMHPPMSAQVYMEKPTGLSGNLSSVSMNSAGIFVAGANRTLGYVGSLFTSVQ